MGWLRDLMDAAPTSVQSFDQLAKLCLKSTYWPAQAAMNHRSLGAILGRLDREEGLDWLTARPESQRALADVLGVPKGSLLVALQPRKSRAADRWVTWATMPLARGLDLVEESLFPGLPAEVLHPGGWERLIWVAPSGAGRSLVGQWLAARGLAEWTSLRELDLRELPRARPLFVELHAAEAFTPELLPAGVCVAVPEPWEPNGPLPGCSVVRSPPVRDLVEPLVRWACERLPGSARLVPQQLAAQVLALAEQGLVASAGDVLGLVGLADAEGPEALDEPGLERTARNYLRRRARERLDPDAPEFGWLRRAGFDALTAIARRVTTDAGEPLFCSRSVEVWSDLLPESARHGPDLEWLKVALPQADPSVRLATIERASEKLPPGAFRILRCFEHLGVLTREPGDRLALRPHWLVRVAEHRALEDLVTGPSFDWGEALLSPRMANATMDRLLASARERKLPIEELVEPSASADAGYAAAIEGAMRALGAAELLDVHLGGEALEGIWDEQLRLAVTLPDDAVVPRIEHAEGRGGFWLSRGAWQLALLAVSEALDRHVGNGHPLLRPWQATEPPEGLGALLDSIAAALERPDAPREIIGPAIGLVSRLGALLGPLGFGRVRHRLERAATVADEAAVGVLGWPSVAALAGDRLATLGLAHLVSERRLDPALLGRQVWQAFEAAGMPGLEAEALVTPELAPLVLPHAPSSMLPALLPVLTKLREMPVLTPAQWQALFGGEVSLVPAELFGRVPVALVDLAVEAACRAGHRAGLVVLWARSRELLSHALVDWLLGPRPADTRRLLLDTAPPSVTPEVLERLPDASALLRGSLGSLEAVRRFLHARIAERAPGFRDAYALLDELEGRLAAVRSQP